MQKSCRQCATKFEITDDDLKFYDKISPIFSGKKYLVPPPTLCPECRSRRRLAFRNERKLYHRKSDFSGKEFISIYSNDKPYKVYDTEEWWSDKWDALEYGRDFDFSKTFFEQLRALWQEVPMIGLNVIGNEDCGYVSYCGYSKHCYLSYNTDLSENVYHSANSIRCKDCCDIFNASECELCYENTDTNKCYNTKFCFYCFQCSDSSFLIDCRSCSDCFGCVGLRNKKFCIFNVQYTEQEYREKLKTFDLGSRQNVEKMKREVQALNLKLPKQNIFSQNSENVSGNYIFNSQNVAESYDVQKCQNVKFCGTLNTVNNSYDWDYTGYNGDFCYELSSCGDRIYQCAFSHNIWSGGANLLYCVLGSQLKDCFGCVGLRGKKYCILNKQYSKEEYEQLVPKIIEQMMKDDSWGEFFPSSFSPFGYNETIAQDYYPLSKAEALKRGFQWKEDDKINYYQGPKNILPDHIKLVSDEIVKQILSCEQCGKNYKIILQELQFYRKMNLPPPNLCPDCRHRRHLSVRNPRQLYARTCAKCTAPIQTTYAPERPEIVYCESCYLKEVY